MYTILRRLLSRRMETTVAYNRAPSKTRRSVEKETRMVYRRVAPTLLRAWKW